MTITRLTHFLKNSKHKFEPYTKVQYLSEFKGKRIAVDAHNWMFKHIAGAQRQNVNNTDVTLLELDRAETLKYWIGLALNSVIKFMELGITPVFVFDGSSPPEKNDTKLKRRERQQTISQKIDILQTEISQTSAVFVADETVNELKKLLTQQVKVDMAEQDFLRNVLSGIGVPVVQAKEDAEKLCSQLCIDGKVSAVYSTDSDNWPFGCPLLIKEIKPRRWFHEFERYDCEIVTVMLSDILRILDLRFPVFVDLCIMAGCDYNKNIHGLGIGKAYELLKTYGSIDDLPKEFDVQCLNHVTCRNIFKHGPSEDSMRTGTLNFPKELPDTIREILESVGCDGYIQNFVEIHKKLPPPNDRNTVIPPERRYPRIVIRN